MSRKIEYSEGDKVGNCFYIREADPVVSGGQKRRRAEFRCPCGRKFVRTIHDVKNGHVKYCGECKKPNPRKQEFSCGDIIGSLVYIGEAEPYVHRDREYRRIEVKCPLCPVKFVAKLSEAKSGHVSRCTACRHKARVLPSGEAAFNHLYSTYRSSATTRRNLCFCITKELFKDLSSRVCAYCGKSPEQSYSHNRDGPGDVYYYNGIDRVDNDVGYVPDNCVPCCGPCNKAKTTRDQGEFLDHHFKVVQHQIKTGWEGAKKWIAQWLSMGLFSPSSGGQTRN